MTCLDTLPPPPLAERSIAVLETKRLVLRAPQLVDGKAVAALANDRRIAENTARIPHPYRLIDAERWIAGTKVEPGDEAYLITLADGTVIGSCGFDMRDGPAPEIGYWLGTRYWGKGYATEAVRALIDHAFTNLDHQALQSSVRVTNPGSRRVLEKCGFQWTGVGLCRIRALGSSVPVDRFRLERGIWTALKNWGPFRRVA
jgi:RimJ/RimL family protein N-acetyltransferase